ncbi:MAG: 50S ribosomal protein L9 [Deltaproteobacteria bacterium]|nr:50S ribosomal protein L9 [Deltaproteobacteria bacterium]
MKLILTETVDALGIVGQEVDVKPGYARNYLLPQKLAVIATEGNRQALAKKKAAWEEKFRKEKAAAEEVAERLSQVTVTIPAKVSEEDKLYGSVSVRDIVAALAEKGFEVERKSVHLGEPIKILGTRQVPIRLYAEVVPEITVEVVPEDQPKAEAGAGAEPAAEE